MVYWFKQSSIAGSIFCQWFGVSPFRGLLELRAPSQAYMLGSTKYQSPRLQFPSVPFYLLFIFCSGEGELQAEITASFLETWCPFFPGRQRCWQAAGVEPRRCLFHWPVQARHTYRTHVLLRCLTYAQPAQLALDALVLSRVCKSTAQHMGCRAHTEILNRNLAYLAGMREKKSLIPICPLKADWGVWFLSLPLIFFWSMQLSIKQAGLHSGHIFNSKLVWRPNVNYNDCLSLLAYK